MYYFDKGSLRCTYSSEVSTAGNSSLLLNSFLSLLLAEKGGYSTPTVQKHGTWSEEHSHKGQDTQGEGGCLDHEGADLLTVFGFTKAAKYTGHKIDHLWDETFGQRNILQWKTKKTSCELTSNESRSLIMTSLTNADC